jgi:hypothetical protein
MNQALYAHMNNKRKKKNKYAVDLHPLSEKKQNKTFSSLNCLLSLLIATCVDLFLYSPFCSIDCFGNIKTLDGTSSSTLLFVFKTALAILSPLHFKTL